LNEDVGFKVFDEKYVIDMVLIPKKKNFLPTIIFEIHEPGIQTFIISNKKPLEN
jgi:hypothetical protein